jgi:hypothetical protein
MDPAGLSEIFQSFSSDRLRGEEGGGVEEANLDLFS